ncbi:MAG: DUF6261 family protein [Capnocytophaga sp.]|nr:DUF6261 family protein [Capnocytophaga sp.]
MTIQLSKITTKDLATLAWRVIKSSREGKYILKLETPLLNVLEDVYKEYDLVYIKKTYSGKGDEVSAMHKERCRIYSNIKTFLSGYTKIKTMPNYEDALKLSSVFLSFASISRLSYASVTAQMRKVIEILETEENKISLQKLNLTETFQSLKEVQTQFEIIFSEQAESNAELRKTKSASVKRKDLEKALKAYLDYITLMKDIEGWGDIYVDLNEIIKSFKI